MTIRRNLSREYGITVHTFFRRLRVSTRKWIIEINF